MLSTEYVYRGRTYKQVKVSGIDFDTTTEDVENAALRYAGESRSSLFGLKVGKVTDNAAVVTMDTD